jgi:hypothetical protein
MLNSNDYLNGLMVELEKLRVRGRHSLYRINDEVSEDILLNVRTYFENNPLYEINITKCARYKNSYDIMITIKEE